MAAINNGDDADATIDFTSVIPAEGEFGLGDELYIKDNDGKMKEYKVSNISDVAYELTPVNDDDGEKVTVTFDCTNTGIHPIYAVDISGKSHDVVEVNPNEVNLFEEFGNVFAILDGKEDEPQYVRIKSITPIKGDDSKFKCKIYGGNKSFEARTVFVDVSSPQQANKIDTDVNDADEDKEPTLEDGAKSGCKKCMNQLQTGKKENTRHIKECPLSSQSKRERKAEEKKKSSRNNSKDKDDDYSDDKSGNSDDDLSDVEREVINGDGKTRSQRANNRGSRNNSTSGNNLGRDNKNGRPREESPTPNSSKDHTTKPAAKRQRKQTGGGKRLSNNNSGGAAAAAAPPVISISNGENTPRNNQNGLTSHGTGSGGAGLNDSILRGSIGTSNSGSDTSNGLSTMDMPPNPNNKLYVEIDQGSVSDNGQPVRKCWVNMATGEVRTNRPSPGELQARLGRPTQLTVQPQQSGTRGMMQQQGQTNMMMPPQQFDMGEMMQMQMMMMMMNQQMNQQQNQQQMLQQQQQQMLQQNQQQQQQPQVPGLLSLLGSFFSWAFS